MILDRFHLVYIYRGETFIYIQILISIYINLYLILISFLFNITTSQVWQLAGMPELCVVKAQSDILAGISLLYEGCYVWYVDIINMNKKVSLSVDRQFHEYHRSPRVAGRFSGPTFFFFFFKNTIKKTKQNKPNQSKPKSAFTENGIECVNCSEPFRERTHSEASRLRQAVQSGQVAWIYTQVSGRQWHKTLSDQYRQSDGKKPPRIGTKRTTRWRKTGLGLSPHSSSLQRNYLVWCWSRWSWWLDGHVDLV